MNDLIKNFTRDLEEKIPNVEERERLILQSTKIIIIESLEEAMEKFNSPEIAKKFQTLFETGDSAAAIKFAHDNGVDFNQIVALKSADVLEDLI